MAVTRRNAVEASAYRAKLLGHPSNLYIVEGDRYAYAATNRHRSSPTPMPACPDCSEEFEGFNISTRSLNRPTRVGYLYKTGYTIETLWPRPSVGAGWSQAPDGLWVKA